MLPKELSLFKRITSQPQLLVSHQRSIAKVSQRPSPESKHYRLWSMPGDFVYRKEILAKQHLIRWHPGLNAGIDNDRNIYALCDGIMVVTEDKFDPDWSHPLVSHVYQNKNGSKVAPLFKRYINVIPKKRISEFKLIDLV